MAKIICEACESIFPLKQVEDLSNCPVCGEPFWEEEIEEEEIEEEVEKGLMYFDGIATSYKECPELNGVRAYCGECGEGNSLELDKFKKLIDKEYVILKDNIEITCRGCGKEHKPRKIFYKEREPSIHLPRCPVCDSIMLKKISFGSKFLAAATMGGFATPYNRMTYECQNCGHLF